MAATLVWLCGCETGSLTEFTRTPAGSSGGGGLPTIQTGTVRTGTYAVKCPHDAVVGATVLIQSTSTFLRFYHWVAANPNNAVVIAGAGSGTAVGSDKFQVWLNANGTVGWSFGSEPVSGPTASGSGHVILGAWNLFEVNFVRNISTGGMEIKLNGNVEVSSFGTNTTSGTSTTSMVYWFGNDLAQNGTNLSGEDMYFDDMAVATGGYIGPGGCHAVQGKSGAPTYNAWGKTGAADSFGCWSQTPFDTSKFCSDSTPNDRQTMLVDDTALNAAIGATDTINGAAVVCVAKTVASGSMKTTHRIGGVDTDGGDRTVAATDTFFPNGVNLDSMNVFTDTRANLAAAEIGFVRGAGSSGSAVTVEDVWLLIDHTPSPNISITPSAGSLAIIGQILTVTDSDSPKIRPGTGSLTLTGRSPGSNRKTPVTGSLGLVGGLAKIVTAKALLVTFSIADTVPRFPLLVTFDIANLDQPAGPPLTVKFDILRIDGDPLTVTFDILGDIVNRRLKNDVQGPVARVVLK